MGTRHHDTIQVQTQDNAVDIQLKNQHITIESPASLGEPLQPTMFIWKNNHYVVNKILGHWREDAHHWISKGIDIPQADNYRIIAHHHHEELICEIRHVEGTWVLHKIWD